MSVSKIWKVEEVLVRQVSDEMANVVFAIQWSLTAEQKNDQNNVIARTVTHGYSYLDEPSANNFIPMENITSSQLLSWTKDALGEKVKEYEAQTYNLTVNQKCNTFSVMVLSDDGQLVEKPVQPIANANT